MVTENNVRGMKTLTALKQVAKNRKIKRFSTYKKTQMENLRRKILNNMGNNNGTVSPVLVPNNNNRIKVRNATTLTALKNVARRRKIKGFSTYKKTQMENLRRKILNNMGNNNGVANSAVLNNNNGAVVNAVLNQVLNNMGNSPVTASNIAGPAPKSPQSPPRTVRLGTPRYRSPRKGKMPNLNLNPNLMNSPFRSPTNYSSSNSNLTRRRRSPSSSSNSMPNLNFNSIFRSPSNNSNLTRRRMPNLNLNPNLMNSPFRSPTNYSSSNSNLTRRRRSPNLNFNSIFRSPSSNGRNNNGSNNNMNWLSKQINSNVEEEEEEELNLGKFFNMQKIHV